jgi:hypothetical protein
MKFGNPARTVIAETQSKRNVEPSFRHTETDACTIQHKNIYATGVFFIIREFKTTPVFQMQKLEEKKTSSYIWVNTVSTI